MNSLIVGDTTTGKSETVRKMTSLLRAGMLITAETASTVGLTGTATQLEREGWFVDWGFLVLNDRRLLAVDGAQKLSASQWASLAESERSGVVTIAKAAKSSGYARTRQLKLANPVNAEMDKYVTKALAEFLYPVQALPTILDPTSIARLDFAVFADQRDVGPSEINKLRKNTSTEDLEILGLLAESLKWCWCGKTRLEFTREAEDELLNQATQLHEKFFTPSIPLVSIDFKWKLARLTSALAYLTLSTEDFETVTVTKEHVTLIVKFLEEEYAKSGLNAQAQGEKFDVLTKEELTQIKSDIASATNPKLSVKMLDAILEFIVLQGRVTRDQLKQEFTLAEKNQLRPLMAALQNERMIRLGKGIYPTPQLIQAFKIAKFATIANPGKGVVEKHENEDPLVAPRQIQPPSFPDHGKQGNLGKVPAEILTKVGTLAHNRPAPGNDGWMVDIDLRSLLSPAEYEILRRSDLLETKDDATLVRLKSQ